MSENNQNLAIRAAIAYQDGSMKAIQRGMVFHFKKGPDAAHEELVADIIGMTDDEIRAVVEMFIAAGIEYGIIQEEPSPADNPLSC